MSDAKRKREGEEDGEGEDELVFDVEAVRGMRKTRGGHVEYLIKWAGYSSDQNSWEREENLQCPEKVEEFHEAQRQKAAAKRARAASSGKTSGGEENSGSAANVRSPVKSEGPAKDDGSGRSPVVAAKGEKKSVENGDEVERIMGARRNAMTSELELYVKWKGEPVMSFAPAKEVRRKYPDMLIDFYESRLRFPHEKRKRDDD